MSNAVTFSEFARLQDWSPSYVTKLKADGRLVLTADGKVDVEASVARIKETEDPNRDDVRARHAKAREGGAPASPPVTDRVGQTFAASRAVKEKYLALTAEAEYRRMIGNLVETATVRAAGAEAGTVLRATLENLPDNLAVVLADGDPERERRIHARLVEHIDLALHEIADKLKSLSERVVEAQT